MADDDGADTRDGEVAQWLEVEPLDELTRRRLVANALREGDAAAAPAAPPTRSSHAWRWLTAAAAVVVVLVVGLALLSGGGGNDEQATSRDRAALTPKSAAPTRDVGDFGNLDDPANLAALRRALGNPADTAEFQAPPEAAGDALGSSSDTTSGAASSAGDATRLCGAVLPDGGRIVAEGTGTVDGRPATVVLLEAADGTRSLVVVLEDPCEQRELP